MKRPQANDWHRTMYDLDFIKETLASKKMLQLANEESKFLIRELGLVAGDRVLDIPCGAGRHSRALAQQGIQVTGVDINQDCLKLARQASQNLKAVVFTRGDMSELKIYRKQFDAVLNLFSSFGYYSTDRENEKVMREMVMALKVGGRIAIHLINRHWLLDVFKPVDWSVQNGTLELEARRYDPETHLNEARRVRLNLKNGRGKSYYHRIRLYSKTEMVALMKKCGLKKIRVHGNFKGDPFNRSRSSHPIYVGER